MKPMSTIGRGLSQHGVSAMVHIKPAPSSTVYSSVVLQRLQSFGRVLSFRRSRIKRQTEGQHFKICFESSAVAYKAVEASPLKVQAYHNLPSGKSLDPFNVFGLQGRKRPTAQTFECDLRLVGRKDQEESERTTEGRVLLKDERTGALYRNLLEVNAPMNLLEGLATTIQTDEDEARAPARHPDKLRKPIKLMDMYRAAINRDVKEQEELPPIRKHLTGGYIPRKGTVRHQNGR